MNAPLHNFTPLPADLIEAQVDEMHAVCIPVLTPITTRARTLNPDLWPSLDGEGDK